VPVAGFLASVAMSSPVRELRTALSEGLGVPPDGVNIMHEGRDLEDAKTLSENFVHLPGPARRRAGEKAEVFFSLAWDVVERLKRQESMKGQKDEALEAKRRELGLQEAKRLREEEAERSIEEGFAVCLEQFLGPSRARFASLQAADPELVAPPNYLEPCPRDMATAMEDLMRRTWLSHDGKEVWQGFEKPKALRVVSLLRNEHPLLMERYLRARAEVTRGQHMQPQSAATAQAVLSEPGLSFLGAFDSAVNEFPLWHGTPDLRSAGGICQTGFDIAYAGTSAGSCFSPGFYFAQSSCVSHCYAKDPFTINSKYRHLHVMLLCRVVCGNMYPTSKAPSEAEKERLTAMCLGPGGTFSAKSEYQSILGGGWAYVCMHRDQVYPEYVIIYSVQ